MVCFFLPILYVHLFLFALLPSLSGCFFLPRSAILSAEVISVKAFILTPLSISDCRIFVYVFLFFLALSFYAGTGLGEPAYPASMNVARTVSFAIGSLAGFCALLGATLPSVFGGNVQVGRLEECTK